MISLFRRHMASCKFRTRKHRSCQCPIWADGYLDGVRIRQSLDLRSWEAAVGVVREWEVNGKSDLVGVEHAADRFLANAESRNLSPAAISKYKQFVASLKKDFKERSLRSITVDELRTVRERWTVSGTTVVKRLEFMRAFFRFCVDSGWLQSNPAKAIKMPKIRRKPTLPFSHEEWEKILWAIDSYREIHPQSPERIQKKLEAFILLMRYSGIRISDCVMMKRDRIKNGKLFLYSQKTNVPVWVPLPKLVLDALEACDEGDEYYFWTPGTKVKTWANEWEERLKKVFTIAGVPHGHSHMLRNTFSVSLLEAGVPLETVAILLGNTLKVAERHYAPFVKSRQVALEIAIEKAWKLS
jgi:integrase